MTRAECGRWGSATCGSWVRNVPVRTLPPGRRGCGPSRLVGADSLVRAAVPGRAQDPLQGVGQSSLHRSDGVFRVLAGRRPRALPVYAGYGHVFPGAGVSMVEMLSGEACQQPEFAESNIRHSRANGA